MSGIDDQGMMPPHVQPQQADDRTMDERVASPPDADDPDAATGTAGEGRPREESAEQTEVDQALAGISEDERADSARLARGGVPQPGEDVTRSQRNP
ncbi:hypothetical protein [Microbacterium sp. NPDC058345]|uniref:hypothetical protein n=1 Tax=Microbacterium sp. NPDC058345 TaxID=3346455 RepID=UPI0036639DFA